ncbi:hypothetical protein [Ruegeria marina]|nr:hypothetical protein [Ruegeria marina]
MAKLIETPYEYFFETPLYEEIEMNCDNMDIRPIFGSGTRIFDGFCCECGKNTTFTLRSNHEYSFSSENFILKVVGSEGHIGKSTCVCARSTVEDYHKITALHIVVKVESPNVIIKKIGMYPSLADIANDESKKYRGVLSKENSNELHKAIGLAAHGVGIGSFVYLRRIFERLIYSRFEEFKGDEGWDETEFAKMRMSDKIKHLRGHLPDFLVEHSELYSILSSGIHELSEQKCLEFFAIGRGAIIEILEEDRLKKEKLDRKKDLARSIAAFKGNQTSEK